LIGDDLIENEFIKILGLCMIQKVLIDIEFIKIPVLDFLLLEKQGTIKTEMKLVIFLKVLVKRK
jgi:hypothetical protein